MKLLSSVPLNVFKTTKNGVDNIFKIDILAICFSIYN